MKPLLLPILAVTGLVLAGCGVSLSESPPASELFTDLSIIEQARVLEPVTAVLEYEQVYPLPIETKCYLVRREDVRWLVAKQTIAANPDDSPEPEGVPGRFTFRFLVSKPGKHTLECLTPKDPTNVVSVRFEVSQPAGSLEERSPRRPRLAPAGSTSLQSPAPGSEGEAQ